MEMGSKRMTVPITGAGSSGTYPYAPKYSQDGGVTGFDNAIYDWKTRTVTAEFKGVLSILEAIADEPDVIAVDDLFTT
jgi:hypothetical protein